MTAKPKRRWYQFNLASLLLSIAVLGIILAAGKWAYDEYLPVPWIQFSHSKLKELRSDSRPVIIHFIAMWGEYVKSLKSEFSLTIGQRDAYKEFIERTPGEIHIRWFAAALPPHLQDEP